MIQRFVRTADLDKVYAAAGQVFARANVTGMKLEAFKYYYIPSKEIGLAGIVAKPTPELLKLQADLIAAVAPFTVETGASAAFITTPEDPDHRPGPDRIRVDVRSEGFRRAFQSARHHRRRPAGIPRQDAGRTV